MMKDVFILMLDGHDLGEFRSSKSGKNAFRLADAVLRSAGVDMSKHIFVLRKEFSNV